MMKGPIHVYHPRAELRARLESECDPRRQRRLKMLLFLAESPRHTRADAARLLGVNRETVGDWVAAYEQGGLDALLNIRQPPGPKPSLPDDVLAALKEKLTQSPSFTPRYLHHWIEQTFGVSTTLGVVNRAIKRLRDDTTPKPEATASTATTRS